jgi:flagellar motor switch protein FliG
MATADYNGVQKAAILLITLGPERSADIFKHLKEEEIEELTLEIANTRSVSPQVKEDILNEFYQVCLAQQYIAEGGIGYAKELLDKALGQEKAQEVISKLTASLQAVLRMQVRSRAVPWKNVSGNPSSEAHLFPDP